MLLSLWKNFKGYVRISVRGFSKERFLNLLAANNIYAWDIVYSNGVIILSVTVKGLKKMRPILKKTDCRFKIISKHGFPFYIFRYRKRSAFIIGLCLFFFLLIIMSQFIWLVDITGNINISDAEILRFCKEQGVYEGACKYKIDTDLLKLKLRQNYPQISWISIVKRGTRLLVEISENVDVISAENNDMPCDIISQRDCIITEIIAQNGTPCVNVGDTVKKGEVLIRAAFDVKDDNGNTAPFSPAHSSGIVRGKWYTDFDVSLPYINEIKRYTGNKKIFYSLKIFNVVFNCDFLNYKVKFNKYDVSKRNIQLGFGPDHPLPAVITKTVYSEYDTIRQRLTKQQAKTAAEKLINKKILTSLPYSCSVLDKNLMFEARENGIYVSAKLLIEDNIGGNSINGTTENTDR